MHIKYHFMEPGEDIMLVRMSHDGPKTQTIHIVITIREKDLRELVHNIDLKTSLLDFDGTFTRIGTVWSQDHLREEKYATGWQELRKRLPIEGHRDLDRHYGLYKDGKITPLEWIYVSVACYQQYGLTVQDVRETAGAIPFRDGHEEFISLLNSNFVKSSIVSFGMKEWIDCRNEFTDFPHETVASSFLADPNGKIIGVEAGVTEDTKGNAAREILARNGWGPMNAFSVGNSWHDRHLFSAAGISAYLSHGGYKGTNMNHAAEIEKLKSVATAIIFDDSLHGVNDFLKRIVAKNF